MRTDTAYELDAAPVIAKAAAARITALGRLVPQDLDFVLHELLANALIHGNLQVQGSTAGDVEDMMRFGGDVDAALADAGLCARMVWVSVAIDPDCLEITVDDQGLGYDARRRRDDPYRPHGLAMVQSAVDALRVEEHGRRTIVLMKLKPAAAAEFSTSRVLVVDDNPAGRRVLAAVLSKLGIGHVDMAGDGLEGLDAAARNRPDLILLDVMMPRMDGFEMCRKLRQQHGLSDLPVLFVTALDDSSNRRECFAAGGNDVVSKPIDANEVLARVRVHLHNAQLMARMSAYNARVAEELDEARRAQESLIPDARRLADIDSRLGLDVRGLIEPCQELGGDFWTVFDAGPRRLGVMVADFSGHGLRAAFNVFRLHVLLGRLPRRTPGPGKLLELLNRELKALLRPGEFAAVFLGIIDLDENAMTFAGGAAPSPVVKIDGKVQLLDSSGPPLGAFADAEYDESRIDFPVGSALLVYSDALVESEIAGKPVCTEEDLAVWAAETPDQSCMAAEILGRFHQRWLGQPSDDLTLLCIRRHTVD